MCKTCLFLVEYRGITRMLRIRRPAPPLSGGLDPSLFERPPDVLSTLRPFRVRSPPFNQKATRDGSSRLLHLMVEYRGIEPLTS